MIFGRLGARRCFWLTAYSIVAFVALPQAAQAEPSELPPNIGYNYNEIETPRIAGMGGAQRALSNSISALFVNPANMAASRVYHLGALAQIWPEAKRQSYGAGAVDSIVSASRVAGGLGATYNLQDMDGIERKWTDVRFALAFPFSEQFLAGAAGRYMWLSQDGEGQLQSSPASEGLPDKDILKSITFDLGVTVKPSPAFAISVVGNNLSNPDHGFQPMSVGGGLGLTLGDFGLEGDVVSDFGSWDENTLRAMLGGEGLFADHFAARLGYRFDQGAESHAISGGVGYIDRAFDVDIAVRRTVEGDGATAIVFGFSYHLEASGLTPSAGDTF
ncbi:MAG TPA: hypothetical protein VM686_32835 [Polyangiaceae bacterium]|nr:hypothetical protein [Polyangiaceae bacterium]